ncbi:dynamin family protein [Flintibacter muris]|uniref:dynamin family protein n=1 Tax=Flintibacter muris TaxID=2941327 RepID=UPI00203E35BD|nr:dynamin family protein [Flintibacter muris]
MLLQKEILQKAGVPQEDIQRLEKAWDAYQAAVSNPVRHIPNIVCTGIYNAGKSTLLNALCGEERFPTGDVPTTKAVAQAEFGGAVYIDTPGLNAEGSDDQEAQAAYESADFIIFVSSAQNGGIGEVEAVWLNRLRDHYTADSLKQRMVYVLTHCGQIEPEQVAVIRNKTTADLEKILGFAPDSIFCVDSVVYQKGIAEDKPLLVEHSALPPLQAHLAELISGTGETLRQAHEAELNARGKALLKQVGRCKDYCLERMANLSARKQQDQIKAMFSRTKEMLTEKINVGVSLYGSLSLSGRDKSFEGKDGSSLKRQARDHMRSYAERGVSDAHKAIKQIFQKARQDYGTTGIDSEYFKLCSTVNQLLEELQVSLGQHGIYIQAVEEIAITPDVSEVDADLSRIADNGDYWSPGMYLNVNEDRIEVNQYDNWYEERGLFGVVIKKPKYVIYTHNATSNIYKEISDTFKQQVEEARDSLSSYYWNPFLKTLKSETDKRFQEMRKAADASIANSQRSAEKPLREALEHLAALEKEISQ